MIRKMKHRKKFTHKKVFLNPFSITVFVLLIVYSLSMLYLFYWGLMTSFKTSIDYNEYTMTGKLIVFPTSFTLENYRLAFQELGVELMTDTGIVIIGLPHLIFNTLFYGIASTIITTLVHACTAYLAAKYSRIGFVKILYPIVVFCMVFPVIGSLSSELQIMKALNFYDNVFGLLVMKGSFLGANFLLFYAAFKGLSWEYAEAAVVDGASNLHVMIRIMFPLVSIVFKALFVLTFIGYWNSWTVNITYLPSFPMVSFALYKYRTSVGSASSKIPAQLAGCLVVAFPIFVLFCIFKNQLVGCLTVGGLKG